MSTTPPRSSSPARSAPGSPKAGPPTSPRRPAVVPPAQKSGNTRMELPPDAYVSDTQKSRFALRGTKFNTEGKPAQIAVNQYRLKSLNYDGKIHQYDINVTSIPETNKRLPVKKILEHRATKEALKPYNSKMWIFDGKALAWAPTYVKYLKFKVDLDEEKRAAGEKPRPGSVFEVIIKPTTEINLAIIAAYLESRVQFNNVVVEAMSFLDHLLRQGASERLLSIKRNFYDTQAKGSHLSDGGVVEVHKGLYASIRFSQDLSSGGIGLSLNVDVANTAFWVGDQRLSDMLPRFLANCDSQWRGLTPARLVDVLRPKKRPGANNNWHSSDAFKHLRKLRRLKFTVKHRGRPEGVADMVYNFRDVMFEEKYGADGANSRNVKFDFNGKETSVLDYYVQKYQQHLRAPGLPLIDAGTGGAIPMEMAYIVPMQRYPFKLNSDQTANMIKIAVTRPNERRKAIEDKTKMLRLDEDPYLKHYGITFEEKFSTTKAKVIPPPIVKFRAGGTAKPQFSGRWRIDNLKFWTPNKIPLQSWGIVAMGDCCDKETLVSFTQTFKMTFKRHGGLVESDPVIVPPWSLQNKGRPRNEDITIGGTNGATVVLRAHEMITKERKLHTQLLFIVVPSKGSPFYERVKKNADCRFGFLSQVVQRGHVQQNQAQYHSNVCMKVNAKLGGATARTDPPWPSTGTYFPSNRPTMVIGVDVSHAAPGGNTASIAAMTMNADANCIRFNAAVQTNGYRTEMITDKNMARMFGKLVMDWRAGHPGLFPAHLIYFRDGVGEGQFAQVIDQEIGAIRRYFGAKCPKITVIVATKRHHIRFFPPQGAGDRNSNPLPGTLVEHEVTHPFMFDFFLNSHVAIQGTARPVHYYVLLDEFNVPINGLQRMIYHQCYSYIRSTTPVSLHPAVYYAHLAGSRARCHENAPSGDGPRHGGAGVEMLTDRIAKGFHIGPKAEDLKGEEAPDLLPLGPRDRLEFMERTMWFI
ncbi:unnamed protein product [Clonostachys rosea f. rosea IK726]|uniref:Piwi domain-containing protein n=2 Tax=Bionectria ochroleuca TaxID=29856 RepID=A0A0B7JNZ7_BIOOC|nr:unnamed protein product [Clonostachys rosea f. rosea IK726]